MQILICETVVPDPKARFTYAAHNVGQARSERRRLGLGHLPVHVWRWGEDSFYNDVLLEEFNL